MAASWTLHGRGQFLSIEICLLDKAGLTPSNKTMLILEKIRSHLFLIGFVAVMGFVVFFLFIKKDPLVSLFEDHRSQFEEMKSFAYSQPQLKSLSVKNGEVENINGWRKRDQKFESIINGAERDYLNSAEEVLAREGLDKGVFEKIVAFLGRFNIQSIFKCAQIESCREPSFIEFEVGLCGLRYNFDGRVLQSDHEYVQTNLIQSNWYHYCRDWN